MTDYSSFQELSPTTFSDVLSRDRVMDSGLRPIWQDIPRIAGPAFTVRCGPGDNLMLHAAIYRAAPGSVIVVQSADLDYAVAGGNVCAVAQKRGIAGFVIDGAIRDLAEIRRSRFPVFARGIIPIPGGKNAIDVLNDASVVCGGVQVSPGDIIVADEEGVVAIPKSDLHSILERARSKAEKDKKETLESWEKNHRAKIDELLCSKGVEV